MKRTAPRRAFLANEPPMKKLRFGTPEARAIASSRAEIRMARKVSRVDMKMTTGLFQASVDNAGTVVNILSNLSRGTGMVNEFIGSEILPTSIRERMSIALGPGPGGIAGDGTNVVRIIIFQWYDASTPAVTGVLQNVNVYSPIRWENKPLLNILSDKIYGLHQGEPSTTYDMETDQIYIKSKKIKPVRFHQTNTNAQDGGLYALFLSDSLVSPHPYVSSNLTVTYTDS